MQPISIKGQMLACVLLAILLFQTATLLSNVSPDDKQNDGFFDITYAALVTPPDSDVSLETLISNPDYLTTKSLDGINWQLTPKIYWFRITLENNQNHTRQLYAHFDNLMLDDLRLYQVEDSQVIQSVKLGWNYPGLTPLVRSTPFLEFDVKPKQSTEIYARLATDGIAKTGIEFLDAEQHAEHLKSTHLLRGVLVGIMLVIALYNLILFFVIRDNLYLIYIGYILSILMLSGVVIGFGNYIWPESLMTVFRDKIITLNACAVCFTIVFALYFLKYNEDKDRYFSYSLRYVGVMAVFAVIALFIPEHTAALVFFSLMLGSYAICLILVIRKSVTDFQWTKFYIVSWFPLLIGAAIQPLELTGKVQSTFFSHYAFSFGVVFEITLMAMALAERMRTQRELALFNATHDLKSELPNQSLLTNRLQDQLDDGHCGNLCLIKVRKFQTLSAYISSEESNTITRHVEQRINDCIAQQAAFLPIEKRKNKSTKVARLTEDTFALLTKASMTREDVKHKLSEVMNTLYCTLNVSGFSINLTSRVGICDYNERDKQADNVIKRAFQAVEQAHHLGKNLQFYREKDSINQSQKLALASDLQHAIHNGELELYHQPQIDLMTRKVVGSEVLVRWLHPKHGLVLPEEFIPIAEDTGTINDLTTWVLSTACEQLHSINSNGINNHRLSINISGKDISSPHFLNEVSSILDKTETPPELLTFELTESVMVDSFQDVNHTMKTLFNLGIHFSIDDYGTGYSSLSYISQMAFTALKIDKSFVQNMDKDAKNFTIVKTTLDMARALNLKVVAEGIECPKIEQLLIDCNCCIGQGFFYSPPLPFEDYFHWLQQYRSHQRHLNITAI
ncbi:MAG: EAL domain-containing protein [Cellvibrionaceae bacterium]